jgi:RNA polymerase sigma-H factor
MTESEVIERYSGLAQAMATRYFLPGGDDDDVRQEALIGLLSAARSFNGQGNFEPFAAMCIRRRLMDAITAANREKHRALNEALRDGKEPAISCDPADIVVARDEAFALLRRVKDELTPLERRSLIMLANGSTHAEISAALGGSGPNARRQYRTVDNALLRARRKLAA